MAAFNKVVNDSVPLGTDFASTIDDSLADYNTAIKERLALEHQDLSTGETDDAHAEAQGRHIPGKVSAVLIDTNTAILASTGNSTGGLAWAHDTNIMYVSRTGGTFTAVNVVKDSRVDESVDLEGFYNTAVSFNNASTAVTAWQGPTTTRLFLTGWFFNQLSLPDEPYVELYISDNASSEEVSPGAFRRIARSVNMTSKSEMQFCGIIPKGAWWTLNTNITQTTTDNKNYYQTLPI